MVHLEWFDKTGSRPDDVVYTDMLICVAAPRCQELLVWMILI